MDAMMKECTKPHALMHSLSGVGLGIIIAAVVANLSQTFLVMGIVILVAGVAGDYFVQQKK